jgi:hypothetical protein
MSRCKNFVSRRSCQRRASEEQNAQLRAQWKILGARYMELADQSEDIDENDMLFDPIPWDRLRQH